ncbi:MAG: tRNA epoxyqueuosine(34) reductase QueG [Bacteroidetes bacterium]|nr:tRNA epoxyqueuosine(34) reductase QueG [Bacteroidota bacterium]
MTLTERIKLIASEIGFADVGIAKADPMDVSFFCEWLAAGYAGTMGYLERNIEKRNDIREILPDARSVIVIAENYHTPFYHQKEDIGKISRYAWGDDYHDVVIEKLRRFCAEIESVAPGCATKPYVDTGPTMDKQWAVRAGIGWQGKHSNIISRKFGSWFFIGLVITTAELVPDTPVQDFCGNCTACIDACPTSAIVKPYIVNGTKCLSYWTIETKPDIEIPHETARNMDGWIFGCDICQDVCPWNRFRKDTDDIRYFPRYDEIILNTSTIDNMQQEDFSARFRKSPVKRTKLGGLKRNVRALNNGKS